MKESEEGKGFHQGEKAAWRKSGVWRSTSRMRSRVERSWMSKRGSFRRSCEKRKSSRVRRKSFRNTSRVTCSCCCKRWSTGGTTPFQSTRKTDSTAAEEEMRKLHEELKQKEKLFFFFLSNRGDENKMQDAAVMLRKRLIVAWRRWWNSSSLWERIKLRPVYKGSKEKWERHKGGCQEEKKEEEAVKTNRSKTKPVSNWRCQRQAGAVKALQRTVWSLIFLGFVVYLAKAEEQEVRYSKG